MLRHSACGGPASTTPAPAPSSTQPAPDAVSLADCRTSTSNTTAARIGSNSSPLTAEQRELAAEIVRAEGRCGLARDGNDVLALLDAWCVPRHRRTRIAA